MSTLRRRIADWFEGEEEVIATFPTYAVRGPEGTVQMTLRAWVYEPEHQGWLRNKFFARLREEFRLEDDSPEAALFERRIRPFLVDNERWQKVRVKVAGEVHELGRSAPDGHVEGDLCLDYSAIEDSLVQTTQGLAVRVRAFIPGDEHERLVPILEDGGRSIISDIDDTVKITGVLDRQEMMRNTFLRPFTPVRELAEHYADWASNGETAFHYVSSSPWQLLPFLEEFLESHDFPHGSFHLRKLRPKSLRSPFDFVTNSEDHKHRSIRRLLEDFPSRTFVLVGDSGEKDPEIYGEVARQNPGRIESIVIRHVPGSDTDEGRFAAAFDGADTEWELSEFA